jgi:hypothetical protein
VTTGGGGLEHGDDFDADLVQLVGDYKQQRSRTPDERAAPWANTHRLDQRLRAPGCHDAGQRPSGEWNRTLVGAGREDELFGADHARTILRCRQDLATSPHAKNRRAAAHFDPLRDICKLSAELLATDEILSEGTPVFDPELFGDLAMDLAAKTGRLIDNRG